MAELELENLLMIYPFTKPGRLLMRRKARESLERERQSPYTTDEGVIALQKFSLCVEHGEFFVILGPSGCGKSTLLRMIAGLESPVAGEIRIDGQKVNTLPPEQRDIAMVFQNYSLYPHLNVYDNLAFTLKNQRVPRDELDRRVRETAGTLYLTKLLDRRPKELSGGQQQRVAIGRAVIRRPKLFLMDEPFSNLDPTLRVQMRQVIRHLHKTLGTTFIYVTHDQREALALGSRIAIMKDGMLRQVGTPSQIFNAPVDRFVAEFVGEPKMNILEDIPVQTGDGRRFLHLLNKDYSVPSSAPDRLNVGFRPVHLTRCSGGFPARVVQAFQTDGEILLTLDSPCGMLQAVLPPDGPLPVKGEELCFSLDNRYLHFFDSNSGRTLCK